MGDLALSVAFLGLGAGTILAVISWSSWDEAKFWREPGLPHSHEWNQLARKCEASSRRLARIAAGPFLIGLLALALAVLA